MAELNSAEITVVEVQTFLTLNDQETGCLLALLHGNLRYPDDGKNPLRDLMGKLECHLEKYSTPEELYEYYKKWAGT